MLYNLGMYPTIEEIKLMHQKYAPSQLTFDIVFTHCQIVHDIADQIMNGKQLQVNKDLVNAGALLHDIGAYKLIDENGMFDKVNYIRHGIEGYKILLQEGMPEEMCRIAERHTGVGVTKEDILQRKILIPLKDYVAETMEEKLVMYADKFHSKTPKFNSYATYSVYVQQFGQDKVDKFQTLASMFGIPDLEPLSVKYRHKIV